MLILCLELKSVKICQNHFLYQRTETGMLPVSHIAYKIYLAEALQQWRRKCKRMGLPISDDRTLYYTLHFADDQVVITQDIEDFEFMTRKLIKEYNDWGLEVKHDQNKVYESGRKFSGLLQGGTVTTACEEY